MRGGGVGKARAPQAAETLLRVNPDCEVTVLGGNASADKVGE